MKDTKLQLLKQDVDFQIKIHKLKSDQYEFISRTTPNMNDPLLTCCRKELGDAHKQYQLALKRLNDYARSIAL
jgi:hypothetical protein